MKIAFTDCGALFDDTRRYRKQKTIEPEVSGATAEAELTEVI